MGVGKKNTTQALENQLRPLNHKFLVPLLHSAGNGEKKNGYRLWSGEKRLPAWMKATLNYSHWVCVCGALEEKGPLHWECEENSCI